jgi:hypothetical protein
MPKITMYNTIVKGELRVARFLVNFFNTIGRGGPVACVACNREYFTRVELANPSILPLFYFSNLLESAAL